ncbi:hypothetical protein [Aestuariivirga sp.]|uniref:hypothetical protein n=1 Tax=Aestuariivirga sp. TaxID=2650926 RepID=UPI003BABEE4E
MTTILCNEAFHEDVGHAFNELITLDQLTRLPEDSRLRVLQSLPPALLRQALETRDRAAPSHPGAVPPA